VEIRDYLHVLQRRWRWVFALILIVVATTTILTGMSPRRYAASTVLILSGSTSDATSGTFGGQRMATYAQLAVSARVAQDVSSRLGGTLSVADVQSKLAATVETGTLLLHITATDPSRGLAERISDGAATSLVALAGQVEGRAATSPGPIGQLVIVQTSSSDTVLTARPYSRNITIAVILGLLLGAIAAGAREVLARNTDSPDDVSRAGPVDVLATLTADLEPSNTINSGSGALVTAHTEGLRMLRTRLNVRGLASSLLLTSPTAAAGTTTVACGLATCFAEAGTSVALLDANVQRPGVAQYFGVPAVPGLTDRLSDDAPLEAVLRAGVNGLLHIVPAGSVRADAADLLGSIALPELLRELGKTHDLVIVDGPSVLAGSDAAVLCAATAGVLVVVRQGGARRAQVRRTVDLLTSLRARLVGAVVTVNLPAPRSRLPRLSLGFGRSRKIATNSMQGHALAADADSTS
jgi:Mrp family chromosome partitioning ATPase